MKNTISSKKIAVFGALIYTLIIGVGMYISFNIMGVSYENARLVETLWWVEIILTAWAVFITIRFFSWEEIGFRKLNKKQLVWLAPSIILLLLMWAGLFNYLQTTTVSSDQMKLFLLVGVTTLLVGFSEEVMFRGAVFSAFWQGKPNNMLVAVFVSALLFSLLHSVNTFAGMSFSANIGQLVLTFVFGLFFGLLRLRLLSIVPLILFHWLWDFALIGSSALSFDGNRLVVSAALITTFVLALVLLALLIMQKGRGKIS